jgi:hypothetical protein
MISEGQVSDGQREALALIGEDNPNALDELRKVAAVTQVLPPRLALVSLPDERQAPDIPGIAWHLEDVPPEDFRRLSSQEQLFITAWKVRGGGKERPGDNLPWDAPGYLPPDLPACDAGRT